ncbi:MAG: ATP-binding cassette domain-containing protein, partial [SAR202 cluster bacterium]
MDLYPGEILSILGPSGCGKTTLLRIIAGLETPSRGTIYLKDQKIFGQSIDLEASKRNIGIILKDHAYISFR